MNRKPIFSVCAALAVGVTPPFLAAQTTDPAAAPSAPATEPAAPTAAPDEEEEIITLSVFEVAAEEDTGYQATETLAGTRIRTNLRDVGSAISVVTPEFMTDVAATDNTSLLQYVTNAEVSGTASTYTGLQNGPTLNEVDRLLAPNTVNRVRGLSEAENTRDYFVSDIPWDSYIVDRVDIQRGANSLLFGLGKPAGIINAQLASAMFKDDYKVEARYGSYGSVRGSLSLNKEIIRDVLAIRVGALMDHENYQQKPAYEDDERVYVAARFDPKLFKNESLHTSIRLKYENGDIEANRPRTVTPMDAVSPFFKPLGTTGNWTLENGLGRTLISNPYVAFRDYQGAAGANYNPWVTGANIDAQQPYWLIDGDSGSVYDTRSGWINNGAREPDGDRLGNASGLQGKLFSSALLGIATVNNIATQLNLPLAGSGQYRAQSMTDSSIFNFYDNLIDGPNKAEWADWEALNLDVSQTAFNERLGINLIYDWQGYNRGGESVLGWQPTIMMDILQNFDDLTANPNVGRPYVQSVNGGDGQSYKSDRENIRASVFAELRATDFGDKDNFFVKLLGKHRLNGVSSEEELNIENRGWIRKATDEAWANFWTQNAGSTSAFHYRGPVGVIYLGDSIAGASSSAGAHIPRIKSKVDMNSANAWIFDQTWDAPASVAYNAAWDKDASPWATIFQADPPNAEQPWMQNSNPENYVGWRDQQVNLLSYDRGADDRLLRRAQLQRREVESLALSWQGYWWDGAVVTTLGWRNDEITDTKYQAREYARNRSHLVLSPDVYTLKNPLATRNVVEEDTMGGGAVVHLNKLFGDRDPLPINVSLTYNKSKNFQVGEVRVDLYGTPIANPSGDTKDYGILLSTKDGKYSFRAIKFESNVKLDNSNLDPSGLANTIVNGLNWRNVFLYELAGYDWASRHQPSYRTRASQAYPTTGPATAPYHVAQDSPEEAALEDAMITGWNEIQAWLQPRGFFQTWGLTPQAVSSLTDRTTYAANPGAWVPPDAASTVYNYTYTRPQGFAVTADTTSKGYEFEFIANPTTNWRISLNASQAKAYRNNVGGAAMEELVTFLDGALRDTAAGYLPRWGNPGGAIYSSIYAPWRAQYTLMKLQEGTAVPELRKWRFNAVTNYSFREGSLKGVGVGGAYRWQDKIAIGYPVYQDDDGIYQFEINNPIYGPSEDFIDLWVSYERRLWDRVDWKIQLNVRNAFADEGLLPVSVQPDANNTWASVRVKPVQEWYLTNTFSF